MRKYRTHLIVAVVWLVALTYAVLAVAEEQNERQESLVDRFELRAGTGATFVGLYVEDLFRTQERMARRMSEDPTVTSTDFESTAQLLGFSAGLLLDRRGLVVASAPASPALVGTSLVARYPHLEVAYTGRRAVSDVITSPVTHQRLVAFALPLENSNRFSVVTTGFHLDTIPKKILLPRQPISGSHGYLLDSGGTVIASTGQDPSAVVPRAQVKRALEGATVTKGRLMAATPIPGTGWNYVLDAPLDAVVAPTASNDGWEWALLAVLAALSLVGLVLAARGAAARRRAHAEKAQADHRLRMTVQNAPIGMAMVGLDHKFVEPNECLCTMLGYSAEELSELTFEEVTDAGDREPDREFARQLLSGEIDHYEIEKRYVRSDGELLWGRLVVNIVRDEDSKPLYYVNQIEDVTQFRAAQAELEYRASYDPLTGLVNRGMLVDRLSTALRDSPDPATVGVAFCDVDHFKQINDNHGHAAGDEVLKEVSRRLRSAVRTQDTVGRLGGDEFIILLSEVASYSEAERVIERAAQAVRQPIRVENHTFMVTLSAGLALAEDGRSPDMLLGDADVALYSAKEAGRDRCVFYEPSLRETAGHALPSRAPASGGGVTTDRRKFRPGRMDKLIRHALDHDTVGIAYQPVFDLNSGALVGAEALLRLTDSAGRSIPPAHVIPAAESSGLIVEVGRRVLRLAARQAAAWQHQHGLLVPVAVNVSAAQLGLEDFSRDVLHAVHDAGVSTEAIVLELTESVLLQSGSAGMEQLCSLQEAGIELAIDDFGTGYASLSLLHELPAATLKIDQSFVAGIPLDERATTIVAGVIALADNFGMSCIAEGIENESQRAYLAERGVLGQGFLLGIPQDAAAIGHLIEAAKSRTTSGPEMLETLPDMTGAGAAPASVTSAPLDRISGVYARESGLIELDRELARARRTSETVVVALVTLDGLQAVEHGSGSATTHRLLRGVAEALNEGVRPYDLVVRYSSNQFVCAIAGIPFADWQGRLHAVCEGISERSPQLALHLGLAEMRVGDNATSLLTRAQSASQPFLVGA